jgi:hypothetical protein
LCAASPFTDLFTFGMETEEYEGILITVIASSFESLGQCLRTRVRGSVRYGAVNTIVPPYSLIQYPLFTATRKKFKIKEINGS